LPEARYFWPISPRGECAALTFFTVVSVMIASPLLSARRPGPRAAV
jgi:hypothetical protein